MDKLTIHYNSQGESGNIFWILRSIYEACCREGIAPTVFKEMQERVFASDSYEEALAIIGGLEYGVGDTLPNTGDVIRFIDPDGVRFIRLRGMPSGPCPTPGTTNLASQRTASARPGGEWRILCDNGPFPSSVSWPCSACWRPAPPSKTKSRRSWIIGNSFRRIHRGIRPRPPICAPNPV